MMSAQQEQKHYYDENRPNKVYAVGTKMFLSTANLNLTIMKTLTGTRKLALKWVEPFPITGRIGPHGALAYRNCLQA